MAVMSILSKFKCLPNSLQKFSQYGKRLALKNNVGVIKVFTRLAGGGQVERSMYITPSRFTHKQFLDDFHFYACLGIIPLTIITVLINIFIGPAELSETPEGYEPEFWEYYRHPVSRFFARNFHRDEQETYEVTLHFLNEKQEIRRFRENYDKALKLQQEREDYKGWYYVPSNQGRWFRIRRKETDDIDKSMGYQ